MQIDFFSGFKKRENSTKVPLVSAATRTLTGYLKEPCSIMNPVVKIERPLSDAAPYSYTYAYIGEFARWYFVTDWVWSEGVWECRMQEDVLGSFKTDIGNTTAYIDRCASESDGSIIDYRYIATTDFNIESHDITVSWQDVNPASGGCYIVGIINGASASLSQTGGAVTYYALTKTQCQNLMRYLLSQDFLNDTGFNAVMTATQQMTSDMAKAFVNPIQFISSCTWFPFPVSAFTSGNNVSINVGYWLVNSSITTGKVVEAYSTILHCGVNIPSHPQAATRGSYLNYTPFTRLTLELPPFGLIPIDPSYCKIGSYLYCNIFLDNITGRADLIVKIEPDSSHTNDNNVVVNQASAMMGVPIQIAQVNADFFHASVEMVQAGIATAGGIASALTLDASGAASHASNAVSHAANAVDCVMPQVRTSGVDGAFSYTYIKPRLCAHHYRLVDEDNAELGRPLRKIRTIGSLSGYVKCFEVTVDYSCLDEEKRRIHNYLLSGFFME